MSKNAKIIILIAAVLAAVIAAAAIFLSLPGHHRLLGVRSIKLSGECFVFSASDGELIEKSSFDIDLLTAGEKALKKGEFRIGGIFDEYALNAGADAGVSFERGVPFPVSSGDRILAPMYRFDSDEVNGVSISNFSIAILDHDPENGVFMIRVNGLTDGSEDKIALIGFEDEAEAKRYFEEHGLIN